MLPSIPVAEFVNPPKGSRAWNAVNRALELKPRIDLIGEFGSERFYRVKCEGRDRHCVIIWHHKISDEDVAKCDCEAHYVPHSPNPCYHIAAVLIYEAEQPPRKLASMGRKEQSSNGTRRAPRKQNPATVVDRDAGTTQVEGRDICPV